MNTVITFMDLENCRNHLTIDLQSRRSPVVDAPRWVFPFFLFRLLDLDPEELIRSLIWRGGEDLGYLDIF
jgi:hypothetical protein